MTNEMTRQTIQELDALLERERNALLDGDLELLVCQLDEKKALIDSLNDSEDIGSEGLEELKKKVLRNQALLDSALQGIQSVATRMNTLHRIRRTLETYDETGQRRTIESQPERRMEKRA